ncbi:tRNA(Ile)-lysidine synthetase [Candidatus Chlamydia sanziniae]|uniref:tRNA(Ile)-lysidine synthase n=2 Tax=Candidatus Chlamydia sanziniae TaxID=1806891 RepID=A0A1A9HXY5_9CHLA|nr:tRNA(Ile)-lysidine synthetase [Candidatus Chlamydia sanziniae]
MLASCLLYDDKRLKLFFSSLDIKKNYLLALSGGSDSLFLLYLLKERGITFTAVHVDHSWRSTSAIEAKNLEALCLREEVPFVLSSLTPTEKDIHRENSARKQRYAFLCKLARQERFGGIFLGHHANDQAETVLKRLLEGAHLSNLKGMTETSSFQEVLLFRPLLHLPKSVLVHALHIAGISYIQDTTNEDERYLRARMRKKLFPWIEEVFGKNITAPLHTLAEESKELADYMEKQAEPFWSAIVYESGQWVFQFPEDLISQIFLAKWMLKNFFYKAGVIVSRHFLQMIYDHLSCGSSASLRMRNKAVIVKPRVVMIE